MLLHVTWHIHSVIIPSKITVSDALTDPVRGLILKRERIIVDFIVYEDPLICIKRQLFECYVYIR